MLSSIPLPHTLSPILLLTTSIFLITYISYLLFRCFYNLFLHPLRSYPGPLLWRASDLPFNYNVFRGTAAIRVAELHRQFGPELRICPNRLSFTDPQAIKDVLAHVPGKPEFAKEHLTLPPNGIASILAARKDNHARYRRLFSHAFSEKGLRDQESHILPHVDLLIDRLGEKARAGASTDMTAWYNMVTFDVIGDLGFGESFHSLQNRSQHEWIPAIAGSVRFVTMTSALRRHGLGFLERFIVPEVVHDMRKRNYSYAGTKVEQRMELGAARGDFWDRIMIKSVDDNKAGEGMSKAEMLSNASVLVLGGSETSSTALSGATYFLLTNPTAMAKLTTEIRTTFKSSEDITLFSVGSLKYLLAVLEETMRLYPPVPTQTARVTPSGGGVVGGKHVPEGTIIHPNHLAIQTSPQNFHSPHTFLPERWLDAPTTPAAKDNKAAFQPFGLGTRNCIGRTLAYAEMRLILAKVLWHFDLEVDVERMSAAGAEGRWLEQRNWPIWERKEVWVRLRGVVG